jgi:hypothetical protein
LQIQPFRPIVFEPLFILVKNMMFSVGSIRQHILERQTSRDFAECMVETEPLTQAIWSSPKFPQENIALPVEILLKIWRK